MPEAGEEHSEHVEGVWFRLVAHEQEVAIKGNVRGQNACMHVNLPPSLRSRSPPPTPDTESINNK